MPLTLPSIAFPKLACLRTTNQSSLILAAPAAQPALTSAAPGLCEIAQHHTRLSFITGGRLLDWLAISRLSPKRSP